MKISKLLFSLVFLIASLSTLSLSAMQRRSFPVVRSNGSAATVEMKETGAFVWGSGQGAISGHFVSDPGILRQIARQAAAESGLTTGRSSTKMCVIGLIFVVLMAVILYYLFQYEFRPTMVHNTELLEGIGKSVTTLDGRLSAFAESFNATLTTATERLSSSLLSSLSDQHTLIESVFQTVRSIGQAMLDSGSKLDGTLEKFNPMIANLGEKLDQVVTLLKESGADLSTLKGQFSSLPQAIQDAFMAAMRSAHIAKNAASWFGY